MAQQMQQSKYTICASTRTTNCDIMCLSMQAKAVDIIVKPGPFSASFPYKPAISNANKNLRTITLYEKARYADFVSAKSVELKRERDVYFANLRVEEAERAEKYAKSSVTIQSMFRGFRVRRSNTANELERKAELRKNRRNLNDIQEELCRLAQAAGLKPIPGLSLEFKGRASRRLAQIENAAAIRLVNFFRMILSRKLARVVVEERRMARKLKKIRIIISFFLFVIREKRFRAKIALMKAAAVTAIQCCIRIYLSRRCVRLLRKKLLEWRRRNESATKIQRNCSPLRFRLQRDRDAVRVNEFATLALDNIEIRVLESTIDDLIDIFAADIVKKEMKAEELIREEKERSILAEEEKLRRHFDREFELAVSDLAGKSSDGVLEITSEFLTLEYGVDACYAAYLKDRELDSTFAVDTLEEEFAEELVDLFITEQIKIEEEADKVAEVSLEPTVEVLIGEALVFAIKYMEPLDNADNDTTFQNVQLEPDEMSVSVLSDTDATVPLPTDETEAIPLTDIDAESVADTVAGDSLGYSSVGDDTNLASVLAEIAKFYVHGQYSRALSTMCVADSLIGQADAILAASMSLLHAKCAIQLGDIQEAADILIDLEIVANQVKELRNASSYGSSLQASIFICLGDISLYKSHFDDAHVSYAKALRISETTGKIVGDLRKLETEDNVQLLAISKLADLCMEKGDYARVTLYFNKFDKVCESLVDVSQDTKTLHLAPTRARFANLQGRYEEAAELYEKCEELLRRRHPEGHPQLGVILVEQGLVYLAMSKLEAAKASIDESLIIRKNFFSPPHQAISSSVQAKGRVLYVLGQYQLARSELEFSFSLDRERADKIPDGDEMLKRSPSVARSVFHLAEVKLSLGHIADASADFEASLAMRIDCRQKKLHADVVESLFGLGVVNFYAGTFETAESYLQQSIELRESLLEDLGVEGHWELEFCRIWLAKVYCTICRYKEVTLPLLSSTKNIKRLLMGDHYILSRSLSVFGEYMMIKGRFRDAQNIFDRAVEIAKKTLGEKHPEVASILRLSANNMRAIGDFGRAHSLALESSTILLDIDDGKTIHFVMSVLSQSKVLSDMGALDTAEASFVSLVKSVRKYDGPNQAYYSLVLGDAGEHFRLMKKRKVASECLTTALELRRQVYGDRHTLVYETLTSLALLDMDSEELPKYQQALRTLEETVYPGVADLLGESHPFSCYVRANIGVCVSAVHRLIQPSESVEITQNGKGRSIDANEQYAGQGLIDGAIECWSSNAELSFTDSHPWIARFCNTIEDAAQVVSASSTSISPHISPSGRKWQPKTSLLISSEPQTATVRVLSDLHQHDVIDVDEYLS